MALKVDFIPDSENIWQRMVESYGAMEPRYYVIWLTMNLLLLGVLLGVRTHIIQPVARIVHQLNQFRTALPSAETPAPTKPQSIRIIASDVGRFASFAMEYYRKHQEASVELDQARMIIAQFAQQQNSIIHTSGREIGQQYQAVLTYANYLEEQIVANRIDPTLRYDFDDVCESSFNLKLIAEALRMLTSHPQPMITTVPMADLMQQTMLALAPALDRRSMRLTTAEVDTAVAAQGDPMFIAHVLWMMMLGMVRYAADESTLRIRCLHSHDRSQALMSIVVSELSAKHLPTEKQEEMLTRQLQHLTPHMFAETIRIHGNIQLASLLIGKMQGRIDIVPLTVTSCEICMTLPAANIAS